MNKLQNLVADQWVDGDGDGKLLASAVSGQPIATITSSGLDFEAILRHHVKTWLQTFHASYVGFNYLNRTRDAVRDPPSNFGSAEEIELTRRRRRMTVRGI